MDREQFDTCRHCGDAIYVRVTAAPILRNVWWSAEKDVGGVFCSENSGAEGIMGGHEPGGDATTTTRIRARDLIRELEDQVEKMAELDAHAAYVVLSDLRVFFGVEN